MRVVCIFPVTNNLDKAQYILENYKKRILPKLKSLGATEQEIKFAGTDYVYVPTNKELTGKPKGSGIIECLKNVNKPPDVVITCDGSGAIPYHYVTYLFKEMISDSSIACVMANRIGNKAIEQIRYIIERFEIFLLKMFHKHKGDIPDGQCGLWCYRYGKLTVNDSEVEIKLTASGYEIELDLLGEVVGKNINHSFVDVELPERESESSFRFESNLEKMRFLINKYGDGFRKIINNSFKEFEKTEEFNNLVKNGELREKWKKYKLDMSSAIFV